LGIPNKKYYLQMEKEQIINACEDCSTIDGEFLSGEKYYKETFE
jgi:hypothetical protein